MMATVTEQHMLSTIGRTENDGHMAKPLDIEGVLVVATDAGGIDSKNGGCQRRMPEGNVRLHRIGEEATPSRHRQAGRT